jgi:hypothetical protein
MAGEEGAMNGRQVLGAGARLHDAGAGVSASAQRDIAQAELDLPERTLITHTLESRGGRIGFDFGGQSLCLSAG